MRPYYLLYFDDTGSRNPDHNVDVESRNDGMDCFGLGGILVKNTDVNVILEAHKAFCADWKLAGPLHSTKIRGRRGDFRWLGDKSSAPQKVKDQFYSDLEGFVCSLPVTGIACVIHRPGYVQRYRDMYRDDLWHMCKTAFCVLVERAAKFADKNGCQLQIVFEESGKSEDRDVIRYMKELKHSGCPFDAGKASAYAPLTSDDYKRIIIGQPLRKTKNVPMLQMADLFLYPIAKGGYDSSYSPYKKLNACKKLINSTIGSEEIEHLGIKYSCFELIK